MKSDRDGTSRMIANHVLVKFIGGEQVLQMFLDEGKQEKDDDNLNNFIDHLSAAADSLNDLKFWSGRLESDVIALKARMEKKRDE